MIRLNKKGMLAVFLACIVLWCGIWVAAQNKVMIKTQYYNEQIEAAEIMQKCMEEIKAEKIKRGIAMSDKEFFDTGMLGEEFNEITTSLGELSAKRTTANNQMAALTVRMFHDLDLKKCDRIGAGFSGSFPSANLAVLAAAQVMEIEIIPITSIGASTHGANNPGLSFPEMLDMLYKKQLINTNSLFITIGGDFDTGYNMMPDAREVLVDRVKELGIAIYEEKDLYKNVSHRLESYGDIDCFVAVGGNITSFGMQENAISIGQGIIYPSKYYGDVNIYSGVAQNCLSNNIPVINILNIKSLVADYGMPFDSVKIAPFGEGEIYYTLSYPSWILITSVIMSTSLLIAAFKLSKGRKDEEN